jgi:hypothetical protein
MADEHSFIYGFRIGHCAKGMFIFATGAAVDLYFALEAQTTWGRVICGVVGAFFLYMAAMMTAWLFARRRGTRRIVVGSKVLTAPEGLSFSSPSREIAYAEMRSVVTKNGTLTIASKQAPLEIHQQMLGSDAELDKLTTLVQQRVAAARK